MNKDAESRMKWEEENIQVIEADPEMKEIANRLEDILEASRKAFDALSEEEKRKAFEDFYAD